MCARTVTSFKQSRMENGQGELTNAEWNEVRVWGLQRKEFFQSGEEAFYQPASTQQHGAEGRERDGSADFWSQYDSADGDEGGRVLHPYRWKDSFSGTESGTVFSRYCGASGRHAGARRCILFLLVCVSGSDCPFSDKISAGYNWPNRRKYAGAESGVGKWVAGSGVGDGDGEGRYFDQTVFIPEGKSDSGSSGKFSG